jgi:hypothetical protein
MPQRDPSEEEEKQEEVSFLLNGYITQVAPY